MRRGDRERLAPALGAGTTRFTMPIAARPLGAHALAEEEELLGQARVHHVGVGEVLDAGDAHLHHRVGEEGVVGGDDRSQIQASISPPAMQAPCTMAMVGLGISRQRRHMPR